MVILGKILKILVIITFFLLAPINELIAKPKKEFVSAAYQTHLLELFSTESCSSCPPADRWVSQLRSHPGLWKTFIPVVFHVDYWDYLGWKDPYSRPEFTQRQKAYAHAWRSRSVYTPAFVLDGKEWRQRSLAPLSSRGKKVGVLKAKQVSPLVFEITFEPSRAYKTPLSVHGALLGNEIQIKVLRGENAGKTLSHNFLSLDFKRVPLKKAGKSQTLYRELVKLEEKNDSKLKKQSAVFWVTQSTDMTPIQAVGGNL